MVAVIMVILWLRVRMRLVRRIVWLRLGWGWVVWLRLGWVILGLWSIILRLRGIIWFGLGRIVRFWSRFGMWLIILGLGFRVGWIVDRSGLGGRFRGGWIVSRSGLRIRWIINWLRLGVMHWFRLGVIYFRKRFRLRWGRWRWVRCRIVVDRLWDWFMNRLWAWFWFRDWARVHRRHIRWWSWRSWLIGWWRGTIGILEASHGLVHTSVLLEFIHGYPVLHTKHSLGISQSERRAINTVDKLRWINEFESIDKTTKGLFAKPRVRINFLVVFEDILVIIQSFNDRIEKIVNRDFVNMIVLRCPKSKTLQCCQCSTSIKSSTSRHSRNYFPQVYRFPYRHTHQLRKHRRIQTSASKSTSATSHQATQERSLPRSTIFPHSRRHLRPISCTLRSARHWMDTNSKVTLRSSPSLFDGSTRCIAADEVTPFRIASQHICILVVGSWAAITWNLPRLRTSTRHQVHAIIQLVQIRVLTADIISFVPISFTRTRFPAFR